MNINQKIEKLRKLMNKKAIDAFIVPSSDAHLSEYIAPHWKTSEWISGFTGSTGTLVITTDFAGLWTDSRYFLQAETQLKNTCIELMKLKIPHTPEHINWIAKNIKAGSRVAYNAEVMSVANINKLKSVLEPEKIKLTDSGDLVGMIWENRPKIPENRVINLPLEYCGESRGEKLKRIRYEMRKDEVDYFIQTALDEIAWTFNFRGTDIQYNPVAIAYAIISPNNAVLYINKNKLSNEMQKEFATDNIAIKKYEVFYDDVSKLESGKKILIDNDRANSKLYTATPSGCEKLNALSPAVRLKATKNKAEQTNFRMAMIKDGVALVQFYMWLEENLEKTTITEHTIACKLNEIRSKHDTYKGESFAPIVGYQQNGAIVHYKVEEETAETIKPEGILLIDSGGQYLEGTTDITRTIPLGEPTHDAIRDYTLVMKGHIQIAETVFPDGTSGNTLDVLARQPLWKYGFNYGHGTGHGIGHFLNVHEAPVFISAVKSREYPLHEGMVLTIEPGLYREGQYGVRTENVVIVTPKIETDDGLFLAFEPITLFPVDTSLLDMRLLTKNEVKWLNNYHTKVYKELSAYLDEKEQIWLSAKTRPI